MSIIVVCRSCHQRFKVSDKFAGQKGPCPKCKKVIYVPKPEEQVKIHTPEHSEEGARGKSGQLVLKPIAREDTQLPTWAIVTIAVGTLAVLILALSLRGIDESAKQIMASFGAVILAPPLVFFGYAFLRDAELQPYRGLWLWIRVPICSALYVVCWAVYGYLVPDSLVDELWKWAFLGPAFGVAGATVAFACFDLEFGNGFFHFTFYVGVTGMLGLMMGLNVFGG